jgi:Short C-terminal domain
MMFLDAAMLVAQAASENQAWENLGTGLGILLLIYLAYRWFTRDSRSDSAAPRSRPNPASTASDPPKSPEATASAKGVVQPRPRPRSVSDHGSGSPATPDGASGVGQTAQSRPAAEATEQRASRPASTGDPGSTGGPGSTGATGEFDKLAAELQKLADLRDHGLISADDYDAKKRQLLGI